MINALFWLWLILVVQMRLDQREHGKEMQHSWGTRQMVVADFEERRETVALQDGTRHTGQ